MRTSVRVGLSSMSLFCAAFLAACGSSDQGSGSTTTGGGSAGGGTTTGGGGTGGVAEIAIAVTPDKADVLTCSTLKLTATVTGTDDTAANWQVEGGGANGTIDESGAYSAPMKRPDPNQVTITATAHADPTKSDSSLLSLFTALPQKAVSPGASNDSSIFHHQVVASGDRVYAVLTDIDKSGPAYKYSLRVAASTDGGATFGAPVVVSDIPDPTVPIFCPSIAVDAGDPKVVYVSYDISSGPFAKTSEVTEPAAAVSLALAVSKDGGATWSNLMVESRQSGWGECADVTSPAPGVVTVESPSYDFASPLLNTYVGANFGAGLAAAPNGADFISPERYDVTGPYNEVGFDGGTDGMESPRVFSDGDHHVCVTFVGSESGSPDQIAVACSADDGKSFSSPVVADTAGAASNFHHPVGLFGNGMITVAYWMRVGGVADLRIAQSKDGGATFATPIHVPKYVIPNNELANDAMYPAIAWDGGTLWIAYLVSDGSNNRRLVVDKSCDGGATWSGSQVLNGEPATDDREWPALLLSGGRIQVASQRSDGDSTTDDAYDLIPLVP